MACGRKDLPFRWMNFIGRAVFLCAGGKCAQTGREKISLLDERERNGRISGKKELQNECSQNMDNFVGV